MAEAAALCLPNTLSRISVSEAVTLAMFTYELGDKGNVALRSFSSSNTLLTLAKGRESHYSCVPGLLVATILTSFSKMKREKTSTLATKVFVQSLVLTVLSMTHCCQTSLAAIAANAVCYFFVFLPGSSNKTFR